jgi:hypothetical protein
MVFDTEKVNIYEVQFQARCPTNSQIIDYHLEIKSSEKILVELIKEHIEGLAGFGWHEDIANKLKSIGGTQKLVAMHHGVKITSYR